MRTTNDPSEDMAKLAAPEILVTTRSTTGTAFPRTSSVSRSNGTARSVPENPNTR